MALQGKPCEGARATTPRLAAVAAAVLRGVGVEQLAPAPGRGQADAIAVARHRREIADDRDGRRPAPPMRTQAKTDFGIVGDDPAEALALAVAGVQRRLAR